MINTDIWNTGDNVNAWTGKEVSFLYDTGANIQSKIYQFLFNDDMEYEAVANYLLESALKDFSILKLWLNDAKNFELLNNLHKKYIQFVSDLCKKKQNPDIIGEYGFRRKDRKLIWGQWPQAWNLLTETRCAANDDCIDNKKNIDFLKSALNEKFINRQELIDIILLYVNLSKKQHNNGIIDFERMSEHAIDKYNKIIADQWA